MARYPEPSWFTIIVGFLAVIAIFIIATNYSSNNYVQHRTIHHKR